MCIPFQLIGSVLSSQSDFTLMSFELYSSQPDWFKSKASEETTMSVSGLTSFQSNDVLDLA